MALGDNEGITGGIQTTLPTAMTIGAFTAIAWYNSIELNTMIWTTFKRHKGLYFYSLVVSSWGVIIYSLAFLMKFFQVWKNNYVSVAFITIGWYAMVTGQSLVLYSRIHLVVRDREKFRWVLYMIITDVFLFHVPTTVLTFGSNSPSANIFVQPYSIMEKVQVTAFCIQEFIISGIYLFETRRMLLPGSTFQKKRTRRAMMHLVYVNILIILMDITLLATEYADLYDVQITFKGAVYSIKLKLEFVVLNELVALTTHGGSSDEHSRSAVRDVALETWNRTGHHVDGNNNEDPSRSYNVFTSIGRDTPFTKDIDGNGVIKTTEIAITREIAHHEIDGAKSSQDSVDIIVDERDKQGRARKQGYTKSPGSSVVEFAGAGY